MFEGEGFESFFRDLVGDIDQPGIDDKTEGFMEVMTREKVVNNFRKRFFEAGEIVREGGEELIQLPPKEYLFFLQYINMLYLAYVSTVDAWREEND